VEPDRVFVDARDEILDEAFEALRLTQHTHYVAAGEEITRQRLARLFDLVVAAMRDRELVHVVNYTAELARERFDAGFDIVEVQSAFNMLEEAMWRRGVAVEPASELAACVGLLSTVLGAAKDVLARTYVSLASHRHVTSLDMSALFEGTAVEVVADPGSAGGGTRRYR
jgi:hypothetical protein